MAITRRSWLLRIDSDPVCYLWSGHGPLETPADAVDPGGATWLGAGHLLTVPTLQALINGIAERVTFTLSGVSQETFRLAFEDRESVKGAEVRLGVVEFDEDWQLTGPITYEWRGVADAIKVASQYGENARSRSIILMVGSTYARRGNPRFAFWSDASQRLRSPSDAFFNHIAKISNGMTRRFGPR